MVYCWLGIVIFLAAIEVITVNLTTIWFVFGGILAMIISIFTSNMVVQFATFTISSTILLITTRKIISKFFKNDNEKTNIDRIIGMEGIVLEKISKNKNGVVKVDGKTWTASSEKTIEKNNIVKVLEIDGAKIKVEKVGN